MSSPDIMERATLARDLVQFLQSLDKKSRAILLYLWWHRHAEISELRKVTDLSDDYEILYRLKELINRQYFCLYGRPLVSFEQLKVDPLTGQKVLFSWWYVEEEIDLVSSSQPVLLDLFNENDKVVIIAQLPAEIDPVFPDIQIKNGILKISLKKTGSVQND